MRRSSPSYLPIRQPVEPGDAVPNTDGVRWRWRQRRLAVVLAIVVAAGLLYFVFRISSIGLFGMHAADNSANGTNPWAFLDGGGDNALAGNGSVIPAPPYDGLDDSLYDGGCMPYETRLWKKPGPVSTGKFQFPYLRPPPQCRTFNLSSLEALIARMRTTIRDPDLFRLFENAYPNTLDTMIKWHGFANETDPATGAEVVTDEELTYVITGDIDAMWLRDSAAQLSAYRRLLRPIQPATDDDDNDHDHEHDHDGLARLWRGLINAHARFVLTAPYCHSFQPPRESGIPPTDNPAFKHNHPFPAYDRTRVFDCKWELDSLAFFLQVSAAYYEETGDAAFFGRYRWVDAVAAAVDAAAAMRVGMYDAAGHVLEPGYSFTGWTDRGTETLTNQGLGNPSRANGMVRASFRPSDDATIFQLLVPANMMWAAALERAANVMERLAGGNSSSSSSSSSRADSNIVAGNGPSFLNATRAAQAANLTQVMRQFALEVRAGIDRDAIVHHRDFGDIFAYEVDGYGGVNLMDDANIPSLLSIPLLGYLDGPRQPPRASGCNNAATNNSDCTSWRPQHDYAQVYENTRRFVLSTANPYYAWGEPGFLATVGGPHMGPGKAWPMAAIVTALTAYFSYTEGTANATTTTTTTSALPRKDQDEAVAAQLAMLLNSTWGAGVMHESVDTWAPQIWTRAWFGWANGLFGELILAVADRDAERPEDERLLGRSWQ
ncbi:hypothetical protein SPI_01327 [Niveomyces insectorum RCEF 264]|uniref:Duf1237 domain containing protein n=1 Tax=Niveomyces insectorum RCEF 264 TaxID=1081102 RepID=A0A167YVP9_9HYPO|nr:hypothetical protein SPI_01327 [Niveomyces insectorum RCEF 264]